MLFFKRSVFLALLCSFLLGCSSIRQSSLRSLWQYKAFISRVGSILEQRTGVLTYKNRELPRSIRVIVCPLGSFFYQIKKSLPTSWVGWVQDESSSTSFKEAGATAATFTNQDEERGYYFAHFFAKKQGTPEDWIWVHFGAKQCWIRPNGIFFYAIQFK